MRLAKRLAIAIPPVRRLVQQRDELATRLSIALAEADKLREQAQLDQAQSEVRAAVARPEHSKLAWSHWGEDQIIDFVFAGHVEAGRYLDIGCYHPDLYSNTRLLHMKGWTGVNVDPNSFMIEEFNRVRPADTNINGAVGPENGTVEFHLFHDWASSNTTSGSFAEAISTAQNTAIARTTTVPMFTLDTIMERYFTDAPPDFMNIDVEDVDIQAIQSNDWQKYRPKVVAVEDFEFSVRHSPSPITDFMFQSGYTLFSRAVYTSLFIEDEFNSRTLKFK